jgi:hypothetical protein
MIGSCERGERKMPIDMDGRAELLCKLIKWGKCVMIHVCVRARGCVRARTRVCVGVCVCACVCMCVCVTV